MNDAELVGTLRIKLQQTQEELRREHERVKYLLTTDPSEWEPEVIRWLKEEECLIQE